MAPFFSIITPTLQRPSLPQACASLESQTCDNWEHIVVVDVANPDLSQLALLSHPKRHFVFCNTNHHNGGNTCRHNAWEHATGEYLYYLDDDNLFHDQGALERMRVAVTPFCPAHTIEGATCICGNIKIAFFPIIRLEERFFPPDPPADCTVDTANFVVHRSVGRWPDTTAYGSDWILVESLLSHPRRMFPNLEPVAIIPVIHGAQ